MLVFTPSKCPDLLLIYLCSGHSHGPSLQAYDVPSTLLRACPCEYLVNIPQVEPEVLHGPLWGPLGNHVSWCTLCV
jgi:hypothetical protein